MATRKTTTEAVQAERPLATEPGKRVKAAKPRGVRPAPVRIQSTAVDFVSGLSSAVAQLPAQYDGAIPPTPVFTVRPAETGDQHRPGKQNNVRLRFEELCSALAEGWEIVQPIFARPLWSVSDDSATAFNFVLRRERTTRLLTVPETRTVQRFIRERRLLVDYRR